MTADVWLDYLTCGGCGLEFPLSDITNFIQHKKLDCHDALSFPHTSSKGTDHLQSSHFADKGNISSWEITQIGHNESVLSCFTCSQEFVTARGLLHHVQLSHNLKIFFQRENFNREPDNTPRSDQTIQDASNISTSDSQRSVDEHEKRQRTTVEINQKEGTVRTHVSPTCAKFAASGSTTICCNSKECCVTIIPGTHERPMKCCSAIIPKKRKRHMEEHMSVEEGREDDQGENGVEIAEEDKENRDENYNEYDDNNDDRDVRDDAGSSGAIFIDFRPRNHGSENNDQDGKSRNGSEDDEQPWGTLEVRQGKSDDFEKSSKLSGNDADENTVIMQRGMTFSIPVSHPFAASHSENIQPIQTQPLTLTGSGSPVVYNLPQRATFSVGTSKVMTISSTSAPFVMGARQNMTRILELDERSDVSKSGVSGSIPEGAPEGDADVDEERLMIDMDSDHGDEEMGNDNDGSPDRAGGKKRRYPTSRPFKCDQCDHAFNQRIHLKKHMSKHTGVKPFKCEQCDYSTVERSHLKVHIRIHTGEKPFKCTFCEYATAQNSTLKIHLKRHHGGKMFECRICNRKFTQLNLLQSHQEEHTRSPGISEPIRQLLSSKGSIALPGAVKETEDPDLPNISSVADGVDDIIRDCYPSLENSAKQS